MGIDTTAKKVQINKLVRSQLPSFVAEDNPQFVDFLKQYYISQEYQGGSIDIATNFNEYQKVDTFNENSNLVGFTTCTSLVNSYDSTINVSSTEGWPADYGLLKIDNEIITYTGKTSTSFTGCVRGFCGVDNLHEPTSTENLVFSESESVKHVDNSKVTNLSNLFLNEFWSKTKKQFLPGFEERKLHTKVDKANFLRQAKNFYASKGTDEAIKILFGVLFNDQAEVIKPIDYLFAPSDADYVKTDDLVVEVISGNPHNVVGQTLFQTDNTATSASIFNVQYLPRDGRDYFLLSLSKGSTVGKFEATGASKLVDPVAYNNNTGVGDTVITVDSTLGFPEKGTVYVGAGLTVGIATYTTKSSTQFFNVTGISSAYTDGDIVRSSRTVYAYEHGNVAKPVYLRLTNVVSDANIDDISYAYTDDIVKPRQLGLVSDPGIDQLNSWIHNVKSKNDVARYDTEWGTFSNVDPSTSIIVTTTPHYFNLNDKVKLYDITTTTVGAPDNVEGDIIAIYNDTDFRINVTSGGVGLSTEKIYKVGKYLNYTKSINNSLNVSNFVADVQNSYITDDNKTVYVTSGSLPSYEINATTREKSFAGIGSANINPETHTIKVSNHNFMTGELVRYKPEEGSQVISGLTTGFAYAVTNIDTNNIKLSRSILDAASKKYIDVQPTSGITTHKIIPDELSGKNLRHQNFLRKFPITPEVRDNKSFIQNEPIGILVNGVELTSNQSGDSVYYGSIEHVDVERGGDNYDVITPPNINVSDNVGVGATGYVVLEGNFKGIEVVSGGYDIKNVPNVTITGGNGIDANAYARLKAIRNSRLFDAKTDTVVNTAATSGTVSISSGVIQSCNPTTGSGYITAPKVTVTTTNPHTGAEAELTAVINKKAISTIAVESGANASRNAGTYSNKSGTNTVGTGSGAEFNITVAGNQSVSVAIADAGTGYDVDDVITLTAAQIGCGGGANVVITVASNASGQVTGITVVTGGSGYVSGQTTVTVQSPPGRIKFADNHLFAAGEEVIYEKSKDNTQVGGLVDKSKYYVHLVAEDTGLVEEDGKEIALMNTFDDAINGVNGTPITSDLTAIGSHSITSTTFRNVIDKIVVDNPGSGYSNRKVLVNSVAYPAINYDTRDDVRSGISIANNYVYSRKHGFKSGDIVEYSTTDTAINGLATTQNYQVISLDEDKFRLCSAGIGTTSTTFNYNRGRYVDFNSIGAGTHTFKYPDISVSMDFISGYGNTAISSPVIRPLCRGSITDVFLTDIGSGYGSSECINAHRHPLVTISNGTGALVDVSIVDGEIRDAFTKIAGRGYVSPPDLVVEGEGNYGKLISNVTVDGTLGAINIVDSGKDYTNIPDTTVRVKPPGDGVVFRADLKQWKLTSIAKYQKHISRFDDGIILPSQNPDYEAKFVSTYLPRKLRELLNDNINDDFTEKTTLAHSPIVGWSYDGAPIYGPYGYSSATGGTIRRLTPGYTPVVKNNRPLFPTGSFVEDYDYTGNGDLDENNGRFCKTPEFPDGVYAYFCTISEVDGNTSPFNSVKEPVFPYILNGYQHKKVEMNGQPLSLQTLPILNSGNIIRNTLPYKLGFIASDYDYLVSDNVDDTELEIKHINTSGIGSINVVEPGTDYMVGDRLSFNNSNTGGGHGASAKVRSLVGKGIADIRYEKITKEHIVFNYRNGLGVGIGSTVHGLEDGDLVTVSGIGTGELRFLEGPKFIGVSSITSTLNGNPLRSGIGLTARQYSGRTAFIYLTERRGSKDIDDVIKVGDWLIIGSGVDDHDPTNGGGVQEKVQVIEIDELSDKYKVRRETGIGNTVYYNAGTKVSLAQKRFTFQTGIGTNLSIKENSSVTINPQNSIGVGTIFKTEAGPYGNVQVARVVAADNTVLYDRDPQNRPRNTVAGSNCDNTITLTNHGFITGQRLKYFKSPEATAGLTVSQNVGMGASFTLTDGQYVYAVKKSNDTFGLQTSRVGIGSTSKSLYFATIGGAGGNQTVYDDHTLETTSEIHEGFVDRFDVTVATVEPHGLRDNDRITLDIGANATVNRSIEYDTVARKTIVNPQYFQSSDVSTTDSTIKITNHGFKDGDKVLYKAGATAITPLEDRDEYYIKMISDNHFRLFDNRKDSISVPNAFINLTNVGSSAGAGGHHRISRINAPIKVIRGETIGFAVSDPSNVDFTLEFFRDKDFNNRFDGVGISTEVIRIGAAGTTGSTVSLQINDKVPVPLWYKLTPNIKNVSGYVDVSKRDSYPDDQIINGSQISLDLSTYAGTFGITTTGIGSTGFTYQTPYKPEKNSYNTAGVSTYRYLTDSKNAKGGINELKMDFAGVDYIRNPGISSIKTVSGKDSDIRMYDNDIGFPGYKEVVKIGYDYPTDKSLTPRADTYANVTVKNNFVIGHIGIVTAGRNYSTAPDLFLPVRPNAETKVYLEGTGIGSVEILNDSLTGFSNVPNPPRIIAINNTNGVGVVTARCFDNQTPPQPNTSPLIEIKRPVGGWRPENHRFGTNFPFEVGDEIFVENVEVYELDDPRVYPENEVIGYNSDMYDYSYFKITERNISDSWIKYSVVGIGTWGGTFDPVNSAGRIIKKEDLPTFNVRFDHRDFIEGEPVTFGGGSAEGKIVENEGWDRATNSFRLKELTRTPFKDDVVVGKISRASGTVVHTSYYERYFKLDYQSDREKGFQKDTGKPSNDFQKLQDSDYYQNFSYSIQSEIQEKNFTDAVDSIIHPSGYKNFSDLVLKSLPTSGVGRSTDLVARPTAEDASLQVNIDNIASMYVKNDFDYATETTIDKGLSKFITFQNRKITSLLSISSAKVELIDDISDQFDGKSGTFSGAHRFVRDEIGVGVGTTGAIQIISGGTGNFIATEGTSYNPVTGILTIKSHTNHNLSNGATISILDNGLTFTCDKDSHTTEHTYPRPSDPGSTSNEKFNNGILTISGVTAKTFNVTLNTPIIGGNVVGLSSFRLTTQTRAVPLFHKTFSPADTNAISVGSSIFRINNHGFQTGERVLYKSGSNTDIGINPTAFRVATTDVTISNEQITITGHGLSTANALVYTAGSTAIGGLSNSTTYYVIKVDNNTIKLATNTSNANGGTAINLTSVGAGTHIFTTSPATPTMPSEVYVSKLDNNTFKVRSNSLAVADYAYTLRNVGTGTYHAFNSADPSNRTLIELDGIIQSPLYKKFVTVALGSALNNSATSMTLAGITSIRSNDIVQIDDELVKITGIGIGGANICTVDRGIMGTLKAAHTTSSPCMIKGGNFNIVDDVLYFDTAPWGPTGDAGISTSSTFHGRLFNRRDIEKNFVFDDISHLFTGEVGTGRTFTLTENGSLSPLTGEVTGIVTTVTGTGGVGKVTNYGVVMVNNVFQRPEIDYIMTPRISLDPGGSGAVSIGGSITFTGLSTNYTVPRGGKVGDFTVNFGKGYQPRLPASATAVINAAGSVQSITMTGAGRGYQSGPVPVEILNPLGVGSDAKLQATVGTGNSAGMITGITTISGGTGYSSADPAYNTHLAVVSTDGTSLTINVGTALPKGRYQHTFVRDSGTHTFVSGVTNAITASNGASGNFTALSGTGYNPLTGNLTITIGSHSLTTSNKVTLADGAVTFTCDADNHATEHSYPRSSDPASGVALTITSKTSTTITVNVGVVKGANSVVTDTTAVAGSGSTAAFTPSTAVYDPTSGDLVLTKASGTWTHAANALTLTPANGTSYNPSTGILTVATASGHGLQNNDLINILEEGLPFKCDKDSNATTHYYPRKTDPIFGKWIPITRTSATTFTCWVGGSTYTEAHTFVTGQSANKIRKATSYVRLNDNSFVFTCTKDGNLTQHSYPRTGITVPPIIKVGLSTSYHNLTFTGGSGKGFEADVVVGSGGTVIDYNIVNRGYGYKNSEVLTAQGIPFQPGISTSSFTFTVKEIINDSFSGFSFGQLVALDNFANDFDDVTKSFVLTRLNSSTGVKEVITIISLDTSIDADNNLLIFLNDVLQKPKENYSLEGGTTLNFVEAPKKGSKLQVLFYRGGNADIESLNPVRTVKVGDKIQLLRDLDVPTQTDRVISEISDVSKVETPSYGGGGISTNPTLLRVSSWKKQESDLIVDGVPISKQRSNYTSKWRPVSNLIRPISNNDGIIYLESGFPLFNRLDNRKTSDKVPGFVELLKVNDIETARGTVGVSSGGAVTSITLSDFGAGYESAPTISIASTITQTPEIGATWTKKSPLTDINFKGVDYIPEGVFVAVGSTSGIHTSTDAVSWTSSSGASATNLNAVTGLSTAVVVVGTGGTISVSTNKGSSFGPVTIYRKVQTGFIPSYTDVTISQSLRSAAAGIVPVSMVMGGQVVTVNKERTVVVGAGGTILYSEPGNAGIATAFVVANKYATQQLNDVEYNSGTFIAVGNGGALYRSTNGEIWSGVSTTSISNNINSITYGDNSWIAVGSAGSIFKSVDDGFTWNIVGTGGTFALWSINYQDNVWFTGGGNGMGYNSITGDTWYKKHMVSDGSPVGVQINGLTYGDNKLVAVGISSNIHYSEFEVSKAIATATVSAAGTVNGITITNGGFGYSELSPPSALFSTQTLTRERISDCTIKGDYGTIVSVAKNASGVNGRPTLILGFDAASYLNQEAFGDGTGGLAVSGIGVGDYFILKNTRFGPYGGLTSTDGSGNTIGIGTYNADGVYKVEAVSTSGGVVTVSCNVNSVGLVTAVSSGNVSIGQSMTSNLGHYSWTKLYNITRGSNPQAFTVNAQNGYTGLSTGPTATRVSPIALEYEDLGYDI